MPDLKQTTLTSSPRPPQPVYLHWQPHRLARRRSSEPRKAAQYAGAYGDLSDESLGGFAAERHNFRDVRADVDEATFATQGTVGVRGPGV